MGDQKLVAIHDFSFLVIKFFYCTEVTSNSYKKLVLWYILTIFHRKHASSPLFILIFK